MDNRRTGYPKLPFYARKNSNADWGVIPAGEFLKRQVFVNSQRKNNKAAFEQARGFPRRSWPNQYKALVGYKRAFLDYSLSLKKPVIIVGFFFMTLSTLIEHSVFLKDNSILYIQ